MADVRPASLIVEEGFPHAPLSVAAAGWKAGIPVTSHVSIGSDIIHGYPDCSGGALGRVSYTDFLIFARSIQDLQGGVFLNVGTAVTGPEVYHFQGDHRRTLPTLWALATQQDGSTGDPQRLQNNGTPATDCPEI